MSTQTTSAHAEIATENGARYLTQLCKHFQHKLPVTLDGTTGQITFPSLGVCHLAASPAGLTLDLDPLDPSKRAPLEDVVARHLVRFAFREALTVTWQDG